MLVKITRNLWQGDVQLPRSRGVARARFRFGLVLDLDVSGDEGHYEHLDADDGGAHDGEELRFQKNVAGGNIDKVDR